MALAGAGEKGAGAGGQLPSKLVGSNPYFNTNIRGSLAPWM